MAPSSAFPCPTSSISFSFIFSLRSSFHLLCAAVSLPPAASPVPPACLSSLTLLCFFSLSLLPGGRQRHECIVPGRSLWGSLTRLIIAIAAFPCITRTTGTVPYASLAKTKPETKRRPEKQGGPAGRAPTCQRQRRNRDTRRGGDSGLWASRRARARTLEEHKPRSNGSSLHLQRETYGKAEIIGRLTMLFFTTKHPSCH